ncbi:hypothetical protein TcCL_ESM11767, partial [Trypanosoma cruzi]
PSQQPSKTCTSCCTSLQEPTGRRAHGQSSSQTVESPNAVEPTCKSTENERKDTAATSRTATAQSQMAAAQQRQRTHTMRQLKSVKGRKHTKQLETKHR